MRDLLSRIHAKLGDLWWYTILLFISQRLGDVINMFVGLWIVPKYVPMEELGAVLPLMNMVSLIGIPLSVVSIPFLKFVAVFAERGELGKVKALIRDAFVGTAVFSVVTIVFAYFCLPFFFERLRIQDGSLTFLLIVVTVTGAVSTIFCNATSGLKLFSASVWFQTISAPLRLVLMLVLMPFRALSGYVAGQGAHPAVCIFGSLWVLRRFFKTTDSPPQPYLKAHGREIWSYTWPIVVSAVIGAVCGNMDTLVIRHRLCDFESAGYYIVTRFAEVSFGIGAAFSVFLLPMLAGKNGDDSHSRKILLQSVAGTLVIGLSVTLLIFLGGRQLLRLRPDWAVYESLAPQMTLLALNCVLTTVIGCFTTAFTARSRFSFFWYYLPLSLVFSSLLYALTGYTFFDGILPDAWLRWFAEFNPCRLIVVSWYMVLSHALTAGVLAIHAFGSRRAMVE